MKLKQKLLKETSGYTLIEVVIIIAVFAIMIVPVYKMIITGAKIQTASEETYEATLQAQGLLQSVKDQIERDLNQEYEAKYDGAVTIKPWLIPHVDSSLPAPTINPSIIDFVNGVIDPSTLTGDDQTKYNAAKAEFEQKHRVDRFLYEVHIWHLEDGELKENDAGNVLPAVSFAEYSTGTPPSFDASNTSDFTMVEINTAIKDYFGHRDALLWTKPADPNNLTDQDAKAIGEISYVNNQSYADQIKILGNGFDTLVTLIDGAPSLPITEIPNYTTPGASMPERVKISYERFEETLPNDIPGGPDIESMTHQITLDEISGASLTEDDIIQLAVDLNSFMNPQNDAGNPVDIKTKIIRIENNTKAKLVIPVYDEILVGPLPGEIGPEPSPIKIYPVQHKTKGTIVVERRKRKEPSKNFVVGIIVRDAVNSTFGRDEKILSKIVDVYSYDYNMR